MAPALFHSHGRQRLCGRQSGLVLYWSGVVPHTYACDYVTDGLIVQVLAAK